jgi:hypothetical protein
VPGGAVTAVVALLGIPAGTSGFKFTAKPVVVVVVVVVAVVDVTVEVLEAAAGAFRLKASVPAPDAPVVVAGAGRESPVAVDEVGAAAIDAKRLGPALVVEAGVGAAGCMAPAPVVASAVGVKGNPESAVGWAELPTEPMLKVDVPGWAVLPLVNENPPDVLAGTVEVVEEPNTKPVGVAPWLDMALLRVLLLSPKPLVLAGARVVAGLLKFSFGALIPKEKPVPPEAGVVVPKLNAGVCVAGAWVVRENRLVEGVVAAGWEGVPKLNPPVPEVEKENPVEGVVVAVFAVPKVNPPVGAPVLPKLNALMAPDVRQLLFQLPKAIRQHLQLWEDF